MRKVVNSVPFITVPIVLPIYKILDSSVFVNVFGCGCVVEGGETNSLGNYFNANDLRYTFFTILAIIPIAIGAMNSRHFRTRFSKVVYNICSIIFNIVLSYLIINSGGWK